ncbi:MAG: carbohydrate kinase family protein [Patescibacteria group bacterium]|jgi:ribokinase
MHSPAYDIITIGESLRDVFYVLHELNHGAHLDVERNLLCLEYAEKIPVRSVVKVPAAGNSANAAVGSSRLGLKAALVTWVGADVAGDHVRGALKADKVDCRYVTVDKENPTSEATILNFKQERTQFVYFQPRTYHMPRLVSTRAIYYSAMGEKHAHFDGDLMRYLERTPNLFFVFQPGTTHVMSGLKSIKSLIAKSDVFILNKDEAHHLLVDGERTMLNLLETFHTMGAKTVIITDGGNGAHAYDGKEHWYMPIFPAKVVEKTGAGDSFATAVTVALLKGQNLSEALRWGTANSAGVIGKIGPQAGLLTTSEMRKMLKKYAKIKATRLHP